MAQQNKHLPDALLTEVWTVMHYAVASYAPSHKDDRNNPDSKCPGGHVVSTFSAEGDVMETDDPFDGNANERSTEDMQAMKEAADMLVVIGDSLNKDKEAEDKLIDELVECLQAKARSIDAKLEQELCSRIPVTDLFRDSLVSVAYSEVKSRLETFLLGSQGFTKIAMVTHITKGVSAALRDVSAPAVSLAAALSYRFVTDQCAESILEGGGLRNLVVSNSQ